MADIVTVARSQIGISGANNGHMRYISWFGGFGANTYWCAIFVSWCASQAGILGNRVPKYASCALGRQWFEDQGRFMPRSSGYKPQRGDIIFFGAGGGKHTGIVESSTATAVHTIEGNTANSVAARVWGITNPDIYGYGRVYDYAPPQTPVPQPTSTMGYGIGTGISSGLFANETPASVPISTVVVRSSEGDGGAYKYSGLDTTGSTIASGVELLIQNNSDIYLPEITGDVTLEYERKNTPGTLKFTIIKDALINVQEGNPVSLRINGNNIFYGYVFSKSRSGADEIEITCYDQLRYLKNHDTLAYKDKTYAELLRMIASNNGLTIGHVDDTKHKIPARIEECALFDMLMNASDITVLETGELYVLYDDYGQLTLKNIQNMMEDILIDADNTIEYSYTSTIDKDVFNRIVLAQDDDSTGKREIYIAQDAESQSNWGVLQYYEKLSGKTPEIMKEKAKVLLEYYNKKGRSLNVKCFGDTRVRGGTSLAVKLNLGDLNLQNMMVVEKVRHVFSSGSHTMDLILVGGKGEFRV